MATAIKLREDYDGGALRVLAKKTKDAALSKDAFDRLILVAPPQTLGDLQEGLKKIVWF